MLLRSPMLTNNESSLISTGSSPDRRMGLGAVGEGAVDSDRAVSAAQSGGRRQWLRYWPLPKASSNALLIHQNLTRVVARIGSLPRCNAPWASSFFGGMQAHRGLSALTGFEQGFYDGCVTVRTAFQCRFTPEQANVITRQAFQDAEAVDAEPLRIANQCDIRDHAEKIAGGDHPD